MAVKKHLGTITILIKDRHTNSLDVNKLLSEQGHFVLARLGVNVAPKCVSNCYGLITLAAQGTIKEINDLTKKLDSLYGVVAKSVIITK